MSKDSDSVTNNTVHGTVKSLSDNYWFKGDVTSFKIISGDEDVEIWIDGTKYNAEDFPPYTVKVVGTGKPHRI